MNLEKFFMVIDMNKQYKPTHSKRKKHRKIILFIFIVAVIFSYEVKEWIRACLKNQGRCAKSTK